MPIRFNSNAGPLSGIVSTLPLELAVSASDVAVPDSPAASPSTNSHQAVSQVQEAGSRLQGLVANRKGLQLQLLSRRMKKDKPELRGRKNCIMLMNKPFYFQMRVLIVPVECPH